jgi:hypothetical protein
MIETSVAADLIVGRVSAVLLRFSNTGPGPCYNLHLKLRVPAGIVLMGGSENVNVPVLAAGRTHTHTINVEPRRPGRFELTSWNFSYRDADDAPVRVTDFRAALVASAEPVPVHVRQPSGRLRVECEAGALDLDAWDVLHVRVTNTTGVPLEDVIVSVDGPFVTDGKRSRIAMLNDGTAARYPFKVKASEGGRHVPVHIRTMYGYRDLGAQLRSRAQDDHVDVVVRAAGPPHETVSATTEQTVLYLAASPQGLPALRSDVEARKVRERLQAGPQRSRYRIEWCPASRFDDMTQALIDYEPHVVHFSGHGDTDGNLIVEDDRGEPDLITPEGLADIFGQHRSTIRCVIVNACHSIHLARILSTRIEHAVGMRTVIADEAAIQFSVGFYQGLFGGQSVPDAFDRGRAYVRSRVALESHYMTPLLFPSYD